MQEEIDLEAASDALVGGIFNWIGIAAVCLLGAFLIQYASKILFGPVFNLPVLNYWQSYWLLLSARFLCRGL